MHRRSTLWFIIAAAWAVLMVLNIFRHRDRNTIVIGIAVIAFVIIGAMYRRRETGARREKKLGSKQS
jgi:uncharacterized membrane protein